MGARTIIKVFVICQPQKVSILLGRDEVLRLYCLSSRYLNGRKANQSRM